MTPACQQLDDAFQELQRQLEGTLSASEWNEVRAFLDVGEYGVALETLAFIVTEEQKTIPSKAFDLIVHLARLMGIDDSVITDALRVSVRERDAPQG